MDIDDTILVKYVLEICDKNGLGKVYSCKRQNIGFNRVVYNVNDTYVIKICVNRDKELGIMKEIQYYKENNHYFSPQFIACDITKKNISYIYTIEEKINGINLFSVWEELNEQSREKCLVELIKMLKILHKPVEFQECNIDRLMSTYDDYLDKIKISNVLSIDKIDYLILLRSSLPIYFKDVVFGFIHGDIHFNNLIYSSSGLKLIDFECYGINPLDKEFDSINRMVRNPNSLIKKGLQSFVNPLDYEGIMPFLRQHYSEICQNKNFDNRLLIYDCINSLRWLLFYPRHEPYYDILFNKSKVLIKE